MEIYPLFFKKHCRQWPTNLAQWPTNLAQWPTNSAQWPIGCAQWPLYGNYSTSNLKYFKKHLELSLFLFTFAVA